jgi:hypothetical protein
MFKANLLSLNFKKTPYIQFATKNNMLTCRKIKYGNKTNPDIFQTKFLVELLIIYFIGETILIYLSIH